MTCRLSTLRTDLLRIFLIPPLPPDFPKPPPSGRVSPVRHTGAADGRPIPVSDACSRGAELPDGAALEAPDERQSPDAGGGSWGWTPRNAPGPGAAFASFRWRGMRPGRWSGTMARVIRGKGYRGSRHRLTSEGGSDGVYPVPSRDPAPDRHRRGVGRDDLIAGTRCRHRLCPERARSRSRRTRPGIELS